MDIGRNGARLGLAVVLTLVVGAGAFAAAKSDFLYLAHFGTVAQVRAALDRGANVNVRRDNGSTPLVESVFNKNAGVFPLLLERGADVHARDRDGATPLMIVALYGKDLLNQLRMLLDAGADVNAQSDDGRTALIYLCMTSLIHPHPARAVELLLDAGADPSIADESGRTALEYAQRNRGLMNEPVVERLKSARIRI